FTGSCDWHSLQAAFSAAGPRARLFLTPAAGACTRRSSAKSRVAGEWRTIIRLTHGAAHAQDRSPSRRTRPVAAARGETAAGRGVAVPLRARTRQPRAG